MKQLVGLRLSAETKSKVEELAKSEGRSLNNYLNRLIESHLAATAYREISAEIHATLSKPSEGE